MGMPFQSSVDEKAADGQVFSLAVKSLGITAAREAAKKQVLDLKFEPKGDTISEPKFGKEDPNNEAHTGGNTWAGGVSATCGFVDRARPHGEID